MQRVVAAVTQREGRYLLCQRAPEKHHGGMWEFPGGKVEPGETDAQTLRRELMEELAVELAGEPILVGEVTDPSGEFHICFLQCAVIGSPKCIEHQAVGWFGAVEVEGLDLAPADSTFARQLKSAEASCL